MASSLFAFALIADWTAWPLRRASPVLYGVVVGTYLTVLILGLLVHARVKPALLAFVHLAMVAASAALVVHSTGGVESTLSFLYLLAVLDGALLGGPPLAFVMATIAAVLFFAQGGVQLWHHDVDAPAMTALLHLSMTHGAAFFLTAWLAGHLAQMWHRARLDLHRTEVLHARVMESLPVGVMTLDGQGRVVSTNAVIGRIFGSPVSAGQAPPAVVAAFLGKADTQGGAVFDLPEGRRVLSLLRSPLPAGDIAAGQSAATVVVVDDVTPLRDLEESLRAQEKMASIGHLSAAIAHELRNPLAAISGCVELFLSAAASDAPDARSERDKLGAILLREIGRLNRLVTDFLAYARPVTPAMAAVDLPLMLREVCEVARQDEQWRAVAMHVDVPAHLVVPADAAQLRQVVWNLLKNALEASPRHAGVFLRARREAGAVVLEVEDRGPGIPARIAKRMFEPFQTTKEHGTGLGLAIVHSIVAAHRGRVQATPGSMGGTLVRVVLPDAIA